MTLWWIERVRDGEVEIAVEASAHGRFCEGYMSAVRACQPSDAYRLCSSKIGGARKIVDEYVPPEKGSGSSNGEWKTGPWRTNDGRECVILQVQEDGVLHWAVATPNGSWNVYCGLPCRAIHHPAPSVREVVQYHRADAGVVYRVTDGNGTQVRWKIRGGKIVGVELVEGEQ